MRKRSAEVASIKKLLLPVLIVAGAAFLWSCGDNKAPVPETTAYAETPQAKPHAEQALLDDLAVANRGSPSAVAGGTVNRIRECAQGTAG